MKVLVQVDVQNVYHGARTHTDNRGRVDYAKLIKCIEREIAVRLANAGDEIDTTVLGYVVQTPRNQGLSFFAFLKRIGYALRVRTYPDGKSGDDEWNGTVSSMMQMDYIEHAPGYDVAVVVSGSGVFAPVFTASRQNWPYVVRVVAVFKNTMHAAYESKEGLVDDLIYLDDEVLYMGD